VGTWKGTGISGSTSFGGAPLPISGGGGGVWTIRPDGSFLQDFSGEAPETASGNGSQYVVTTTGTLAGTRTAGNGELTTTFPDNSTMQVTITNHGAPAGGGSIPSPQSYTYQCTAGKSLTIAASGQTGTWVPS
jgi:hypothetical protein